VAFGLVVVVSLAGAASGTHRDAPTKPTAPYCAKVLEAPKHGRDAVQSLGSNLGAVASKHGKDAANLAKELTADQSVWVDPCGELFVQEGDEIPTDPPQDASTLIYPRDQTFALHSKAGSNRVIYMDFNGELVTGTAWNATYNSGQDIAASPFDTDGSPSTFSDDEMAIIQNVWLRVAEDYAPFDVDVTTADPGDSAIDRDSSTDTNFGTKVIVTNDATIYQQCGCAGISYGSLTMPYSQQLSASGGRGNYIWSVASGSLPAGTMLCTDGLISGTTTATRSTSYSFTVRVSSATASVTKSLSIAFTAPLKITSTTLADASVNVSYTGTMAASGGTGCYVWDIISGSLPDGLYQTTKYIKGLPTTPGSSTVTARVTDSAGRVATGNVLITSDAALPAATKAIAYSFQLVAAGGKQPYKWSRSSGALPSGLTLSATGLISGTTTYTGTFTYTVKVTDASGKRINTRTFTLVVNASCGSGADDRAAYHAGDARRTRLRCLPRADAGCVSGRDAHAVPVTVAAHN